MSTLTDKKTELIDSLEIVFQEIVNDKKTQIKIDEVLNGRGFQRGKLNEFMMSHENQLYDLRDEELYVIAQAVHKILKKTVIDPNRFFNKDDIDKYNKYKIEPEKTLVYPYTLQTVLRSSDTEYVAVISYQQLKEMWDKSVLTYNPKVQRLPKTIRNADGTIVERPDVNKKSVTSIAKLLLSGEYKSNALLFNILVDGQDDIDYTDEGDLIINQGTTVNIIDGAHRQFGIMTALEEDPDLQGNIVVVIRHLPLTQAQNLLAQVNTVNRFDKTLVKFFGGNKLSEQITRDLMNMPELRKKISVKTTLNRKMSYLTNFAVLSESIEISFNPKNSKDRFDATDVLKRFFSYLVESYPKEFKSHIDEVKKYSWINHHNTFAGYITLAKKMYDQYGKDFPVDKITEIIDSIDFSKKEGLDFHEVISPQGKVNSNVIKRNIRNFFENIDA